VADAPPNLAAHGAVQAAHGRVLGGAALRTAVAALAARLPEPTPGSHVVFAFDHDRAAFAVALLATWLRGHAVALPASARRRHVGPVMARPEVVALVHDTGAGLGIDVARLLAAGHGPGEGPAELRVGGALTVFCPDGRTRQVPAARLDAEIGQAIADLALRSCSRVASRCLPGSAAALVPGLLAPLAAGATVTDVEAGADVLVVPAGDTAHTTTARVVEVQDEPDPAPPPLDRRPLAFAAVPPTNGERARFRTTVPVDFFGFAGHFPSYPVLSGAVQLHELVRPCLRATCGTSDATTFQDLKFLARIAPGDTVEVVVRHNEPRAVWEFEILRGTTRCSAGRVALRAAGEAAS
jgi:hypothetical protein